jgi:hypothetical protein
MRKPLQNNHDRIGWGMIFIYGKITREEKQRGERGTLLKIQLQDVVHSRYSVV